MVTGANSGIGKETARELAAMGATVVAVARNRERGEVAVAEMIDRTGSRDIHLMLADFSSQESIRAFAANFKERFPRLDVLVNNAGVFSMSRQETVDGLELTFAVNHLGYFMTTLLLMDCLLASQSARVISVSSDAHRNGAIKFDDLQSERSYRGFSAYSDSKLANVLFAYELARRLEGTGITSNAVHPGFVATNFARNNGVLAGIAMSIIGRMMGKSPEAGAETNVYLASSGEVAGLTGKYFVNCKAVRSSDESYDHEIAARLWSISLELTGLPDLVKAA